MSLGSRSGVHWMRLKLALTVSASVLAAVVFARPGTDSSRMWPPAMSEMSRLLRRRSCPTILVEYESVMIFRMRCARARSSCVAPVPELVCVPELVWVPEPTPVPERRSEGGVGSEGPGTAERSAGRGAGGRGGAGGGGASADPP